MGITEQSFCKKKKPTDDVFDSVSVQDLNDHLKTLIAGGYA